MRSTVHAVLVAVLLSTLGADLRAQSTTWLDPERWSAAVGEAGSIRVETERAGAVARADWSDVELDWFYVRAGGEQRNFDAVAPQPGGDTVQVTLERAGATLVGLDRRNRVERIPAAELAAFLPRQVAGTDLSAGWRERLGGGVARVRRVESVKLLVVATSRPGGDVPRTQTSASKSGQPCEIRPLLDPTAIALPSDVPLRIYLPGGGATARVVARHVSSGRRRTFVTDDRGLGHFRVDAAGVWSVEAHRAVELEGDPEADWEIRSATLRFEVPASGAARDGEDR